jgi:hypothetical protein
MVEGAIAEGPKIRVEHLTVSGIRNYVKISNSIDELHALLEDEKRVKNRVTVIRIIERRIKSLN